MNFMHNWRTFIISAILSVTLLMGVSLTALEVKAESYSEKVNGVTWKVTVKEDGKVSIALESPKKLNGACVIPKTVSGYTVNCIADEGLKGAHNIKSVEIPDSIVTIGREAFEGCKTLKSISLPKSVTSIGSKAFADCGIKTAILPSELEEIPEDVFFGDHSLKDVYYQGTKEQWEMMGCRRLGEPNFKYTDCSGYHIKIHFCSPVILENLLSANYELNAEDVKPLSVFATIESGFLSYQWYENKQQENTMGTPIPGATKSQYLPPVDKRGEFFYYCVVTSKYPFGETKYASKVVNITVKGATLYQVSFVSNIDIVVPSQYVRDGDVVARPAVEEEDEYMTVVWYCDSEYTMPYDFTKTVTSDMTLYGKWELDYSILQAEVDEANNVLEDTAYISRYTEKSVGWYQEVIQYGQEMIDNKSASSKEELISKVIEVRYARRLLIIKPEERPVPHIENGMAYITLHGEELLIQQCYKGIIFEQESYPMNDSIRLLKQPSSEMAKISVSDTGFYTFCVTDSYGDGFNLVVFCDNQSGNKESFDLSTLTYEIQQAQDLYDSTPVGKSGLGAGASYIDQTSKNNLKQAIEKAMNALETASSQQDADNSLAALRQAENAFNKKIQKVLWVTIDISGSTVRVLPLEGYQVTRVDYNVAPDGNLAEGIWGKWERMSEQPVAVKRSNFVFENVPDGVYTFVITQENDMGGILRGMRTFTVSRESTKEAVTVKYIHSQVKKAEEILGSASKQSEALDGELCVADAIYNKFKTEIDEMNSLLSSNDRTFTNMVYKMFDVSFAMNQFVVNRGMKKAVSHDVSITEEKGVISVAGEDLYGCSFAKGDYSLEQYADAKKGACKLTDGEGTMQALSNGIYTVCLTFKDDVTILKTIQVSDVLTASEQDGIITLSYTDAQDVVSTKYAFDDGSDTLNYRIQTGFVKELIALGNGTHRIIVTYADGEEDILNINVTGCDGPVIITESNQITVYDYGFDLEVSLYAKGQFSSWEEMYQCVCNVINVNAPTDTSQFEKGEYTFYFQDKDGTVYWKYVTIE